MGNNIQKRKFISRITLTALSLTLFFLFLFSFVFPDLNMLSPCKLFAQGSEEHLSAQYDYVLVIDESGSMKTNDPQNLRKDAAKLFIYLAEIMNKGNRALISGFGEKTNVYADLTEISNNEDDISSAIDEIKSDQDLTDMKSALEKIKQILDSRIEKKNTVVIFLTDGSLTIDDIPIDIDTDQKPSEDKPERTPGRVQEDQSIPESPGIIEEDTEGETDKPVSRTPEGYLEEYKRDLISLCYAYQSDGIIIHPIAFTKESEVEILEQMAGITGGVCWKADEASDLRTSFIGILKNITSRFIKIEEQVDPGNLKGDFVIDDYIKELIVLALKNDYNTNPQIKLSSPWDSETQYDDYIEESIFKIGKISSPQKGDWEYEISGDSIFVYDILNSHVKEPGFFAYTTDAEVPLMVDISEILNGSYEVDLKDFEINAEVLDPDGNKFENIKMNDSGTENDKKSSDGIFSGVYENLGISGYYNVSFSIKHLPTDSVSSNNISFRAYSLPVDINIIEPASEFYSVETQVNIAASLKQKPGIDREFKTDDYEIKCIISNEQGILFEDILLLDNGQESDEIAGDGIYTSIFKNTSTKGHYTITYLIRDKVRMDTPAYTGLESYFEMGDIIEEVTAETQDSPVIQEVQPTQEQIEKQEGGPISTTILIIIIASGVVIVTIIVLLIYFLIVNPRRRNQVKQ